jgi:hypothetical protein
MTDCDMHARLEMAGFNIEDRPAGLIWDVASSLNDLIVLYRKKKDPNGVKVPEASFKDPNNLAAWSEAVAANDKQSEEEGIEKS